MAEEILYCPSCHQKVRVPEEMLGQPMQCPLCRLIFTAPMRGAAAPPAPLTVLPVNPTDQRGPNQQGADGRAAGSPEPGETAEALRRPGKLMVLVGALGLVFQTAEAIRTRALGVEGVAEQMAVQAEAYESMGIQPVYPPPEVFYVIVLVILCVGMVVRLMMIFAGMQMLRMRGYGMAVAGGLAALVPLIDCPCCLVSPLIGIWSLVVLFRSEIRNAFE